MADKKPAEKKKEDDVDPKSMPDAERFKKQVEAAQKARAAQAAAASWKEKAMKCMDSKERAKMLQNAYDREVEAHGHSKFAKRLQSGPWQGGAAGAGIGAGVAAGLGTVVGTLVGGLVSVPTAALGGLTGIAVGAAHGPFFHFDNHKKSNAQLNEEVMDEANKLDAAVEQGVAHEPVPPPKLEDGAAGPPKERKKPRKLEVRSQQAGKKEDAA